MEPGITSGFFFYAQFPNFAENVGLWHWNNAVLRSLRSIADEDCFHPEARMGDHLIFIRYSQVTGSVNVCPSLSTTIVVDSPLENLPNASM